MKRVILLLAVLLGITGPAYAVPSYARQTGMTCQACHTVFPELTPFGRLFKLNGYQIDNLPQVQGITASKDATLMLNQIPPLSFMFQGALTRTGRPLPDSGLPEVAAQNGQALFPQQASLFYAGRIAPHLGSFVQITYDGAAGTVGWDNTDLRYARQHGGVYGLTYGFTANNNPTVQDVWNSTPAWRSPFDQGTSAAPAPGAGTQIDGGLGDRGVVGLTGYVWLKNSLYGEFGLYRSAPQGFSVHDAAGPLDSTAGGVVTGAAPYWRVAYERQWRMQSLAVGAYGITARLSSPDQQVGPPLDRFRDAAVDAQYQYIADRHIVSAQTTYIHERQQLDGGAALGLADHPVNTLSTFRLGGTYYFMRRFGGSLGTFSTTGTSDALLYQAAPTFGFANNSPDSTGWTGEIDYVPWQNVKFLMQYVDYHKFNGAGAGYDGAGRNAKDNNTLYVLGWVAF
ncbi:MAG: cytochrome C [Acidobacteriota bacterium]